MKNAGPALLVGLSLAAGACASRQLTYTPPTAGSTPAFKENADWKPAQPQDAVLRGDWWTMFGDPELNALEAQVTVSNQTIKAFEAQYAQSRAVLRSSRAALYPQVSASPAIVGQQPSGDRAFTSFHDSFVDFFVPATASYEADVWGRIHDSIVAAGTSAQASAADLESAKLSIHAELAIDYFTLRALDQEEKLLNDAVDAFERALQLTQNRFQGGIASQSDVALAETQLETTRAQAVDIQSGRALVEHAIAVLIGRPAAAYSAPVGPLTATLPDVPVGIPSTLLERRPDIASAERRVASANAQIGVATSAFYPLLVLSGSAGFESSRLGSLLTGASNFWALGPTALQTVFDGGRRRAQVEQTKAALAQATAAYQESVLEAFREVEDQLATLRILEQEATIQARAVDAAERSLTLANNRYRGGVSSYLEVITAQSAALANERAAVAILVRRMSASVLLFEALGGGWTAQSLPTLEAVRQP